MQPTQENYMVTNTIELKIFGIKALANVRYTLRVHIIESTSPSKQLTLKDILKKKYQQIESDIVRQLASMTKNGLKLIMDDDKNIKISIQEL